MRREPGIRLLPDRRRLHLQDGPIDLIVEAFGPADEVRAAYAAAARRFITILDELCQELPVLRTPVQATGLHAEPTHVPHAEALRGAEPRSTQQAASSASWTTLRGRPDCVGPAPQDEGGERPAAFAEPTNIPPAEALREAEPRSTQQAASSASWTILRGRPDCVGPAPQDEGGERPAAFAEPTNIPHAEALREAEPRSTQQGPTGPVARRMYEAVRPYADETFITPMAAVAGAVAEEVLGAMRAAANLDRAYVNNGGDIALHLAPGEEFAVGLIDRPDRPGLFGTATVRAADPVRGIATSGWRGRSFSLGIADAVTVLAAGAAAADAAATILANAVDLPDHPAVGRRPAREIQPDSDLGDRLVTRRVPRLGAAEIAMALAAGERCGAGLLRDGRIAAAALHLQGTTRLVGPALLQFAHPSGRPESVLHA